MGTCVNRDLTLASQGFTNGANLKGTKGDHLVLAPPYNITEEEVDLIVDRLVKSVDEVLEAHAVSK
jgi:E3 ubiquitin-protein ligase TRIP12